MSKATLRNELNEAIEAFLANGGTIKVEKPGRKSKLTSLNKYTAWGKTALIGHMGRQYNQNRTNVAGSTTNSKAA